MGYKRTPKHYNLVFGEDSEFAGLEVTVSGMSVGELLDIADLQERVEDGKLEDIQQLLEKFASSLISWNLEDEEGNGIPVSTEAVKQQDLPFVLALIEHWVEAMAAVTKDLGKGSNSGATSEEAQLPMEALS